MDVWKLRLLKCAVILLFGGFIMMQYFNWVAVSQDRKTIQAFVAFNVREQNTPNARVPSAKDGAGSFLGHGEVSRAMAQLPVHEAQMLFHGQMVKTDYTCSHIRRFGHRGDGGYNMCLDGHLEPKKNDCLVYSFGIRDDWSFDDGVNEVFQCEVHSFDPSIDLDDHLHKPNMYFHNLGIWGATLVTEEGWRLAALSEVIAKLSHQNRTIDYVKMDVEGAEFPALREMIDSGVTNQVKQLAIEVHTPRLLAAHKAMSSVDYAEIVTIFQDLDRGGFLKFNHRNSNYCCRAYLELTHVPWYWLHKKHLCCYEVFYVNRKYITDLTVR